jgi:hypothetical protein
MYKLVENNRIFLNYRELMNILKESVLQYYKRQEKENIKKHVQNKKSKISQN